MTESDTSTGDTDRSIRGRVKQRLCTHDWRHHWAEREKTCRDCGVTQPIEKEYDHADESAEIGETRLVVEERERGSSPFRVERERYRNTAHGPDDAYFQWWPVGGFYADESELKELRDDIDRSLHTGTERGESGR